MKLTKLNEALLDYNDTKYLNEYRIKKLEELWVNSDKDKVSERLANAVKLANDAAKKAYDIYYEEIAKPREDAKAKAEQERLEKSALKIQLTPEQADLIDAALGQLSDGYWENSRAAEKYWKNIHLNNNTLIIDLDKLKHADWTDRWDNEFNTIWKNPDQVKKWFARKAQIVQNSDIRYNLNTEPRKMTAEDWDKHAQYLDGSVNKTYRQVQDAIDSLR